MGEELRCKEDCNNLENERSSPKGKMPYPNEEWEWKGFIFKPAEPDNYQDILNHMRANFYRDEPLNKLTGYSEEKAKDMDTMIMEYFEDGLSHIVLEKETNQVAGARIIAVHRREEHTGVAREMHSDEMKKIWPFLHELDEASNIFEFYPELDTYADLFMASVDSRFRGLGLATEMYASAIPYLKKRGFSLVKSCFTSPYTRRIGVNLGFRELTRRRFRDYLDEDNKVVFEKAGEEDEAVVGALEL